ncbi:antitoxin [Nocardioides sp. S-58]|uniref:Antitoxin n=1 Tax=Nocardioides renjunii TaxID=3095075 RepID=A0ABU5K6Z8_9ACTN|nr:antitoxin [Nocardioides sp. S-58]MDZ5660692.1 antitoxin [Nocardioides sp. S-58]
MGFLDKAKAKLTETVDQHGDKIAHGIDKAGTMVNEKTGGKHADKIDKATGKARDALDSLDGRNDDIPPAGPTTTAP